jgi:hypothetical protein
MGTYFGRGWNKAKTAQVEVSKAALHTPKVEEGLVMWGEGQNEKRKGEP